MKFYSRLICVAISLVVIGCQCEDGTPYPCTRGVESGVGGTVSGPATVGSGGDPTGSGGNTSGAGGYITPAACAAGAACLPGQPFCCAFNESLTCAGGFYTHTSWCNGESEACDPVGGGCTCPPGAKRCIPEAPTQIQTCVPAGGKYQFQLSPCGPYEYCNTTTDQCTSCLDECLVGDVRCSDNGGFVERCKKLGASGCNAAVWVIDFSCADKNMFCSKPAFTPSSNLEYCVNECGGRGIILQATECSLDPNVPCSILYCNAATGRLEGDHTACLGANAKCYNDTDCASCNCSGTPSSAGYCIGNTTKPCPVQNPCPL